MYLDSLTEDGVLGEANEVVRLRMDKRCWLRRLNLRKDSRLRLARLRKEAARLKLPPPSSPPLVPGVLLSTLLDTMLMAPWMERRMFPIHPDIWVWATVNLSPRYSIPNLCVYSGWIYSLAMSRQALAGDHQWLPKKVQVFQVTWLNQIPPSERSLVKKSPLNSTSEFKLHGCVCTTVYLRKVYGMEDLDFSSVLGQQRWYVFSEQGQDKLFLHCRLR